MVSYFTTNLYRDVNNDVLNVRRGGTQITHLPNRSFKMNADENN